jgi:cyclophilin family peptidyl-prolyl cis-trans isomerase
MKDEHLKLDPAKTYRLVFHTNCGDFTVTLDQKTSPNATGSLVSLAQRGFFDDTFFHRIVPGFVIQGGDPTGSGTGGPGYETVDTPPKNASYTHGVVAMAKSGAEPPHRGKPVLRRHRSDASLPPDYAVVGKVTSGPRRRGR